MSYPCDPNYSEESRPLYDRVFKNSGKSPEIRLWEAVILTLLIDCQKGYTRWRESLNGKRGKYLMDLEEFRHISKSEYMIEVCDMVDLKHSCLVKKVLDVCAGVDQIHHRSIHF